MAIVRKKIDVSEPLTQEEVEMLRKAAAMPVVFDEDSPELNRKTAKALKEAGKIARNPKAKSYTVDEAFMELAKCKK
jgi:hypothetical protein